MNAVGSEENARFIKDFVRNNVDDWNRPSEEIRDNPPEGWEFLGSGSFRSVWRGPDGAAYKVQHRANSMQANEREYENVQKALTRECPAGARVPRCSFYPLDSRIDGVVVMECVAGMTLEDKFGDFYDIPGEYIDRMWRVEDAFGLGDMHTQNVMIEDGTDTIIPIDFGA